jgi:hypothetical protein
MNGREQTAKADEVVEVMNVVRVPVVLGTATEIKVTDTNLLILFLGPTQFLIDIAGGHEGTVRVVNLVPIQRYGSQFLALHSHCISHVQFLSYEIPGKQAFDARFWLCPP